MAKLDLDNLFSYHAPQGDQVERYAEIREAAQNFAQVVLDLTPESAEQTLAIRKVHDAMMQANSAIAVNENDNPHEKFKKELSENAEAIAEVVENDISKWRG